jgi:sulfur relay (sulfurtransferase) complex TusBCD TusD component (DsrE family)
MGQYLLIETRDPFDSADVRQMYDLGLRLAEESHDVVVFLVQNAVLATRRSSSVAPQVGQLSSRVRVLADDFSLRERAIGEDELVEGVRPSSIDDLVDLMVDGRKVIWH